MKHFVTFLKTPFLLLYLVLNTPALAQEAGHSLQPFYQPQTVQPTLAKVTNKKAPKPKLTFGASAEYLLMISDSSSVYNPNFSGFLIRPTASYEDLFFVFRSEYQVSDSGIAFLRLLSSELLLSTHHSVLFGRLRPSGAVSVTADASYGPHGFGVLDGILYKMSSESLMKNTTLTGTLAYGQKLSASETDSSDGKNQTSAKGWRAGLLLESPLYTLSGDYGSQAQRFSAETFGTLPETVGTLTAFTQADTGLIVKLPPLDIGAWFSLQKSMQPTPVAYKNRLFETQSPPLSDRANQILGTGVSYSSKIRSPVLFSAYEQNLKISASFEQRGETVSSPEGQANHSIALICASGVWSLSKLNLSLNFSRASSDQMIFDSAGKGSSATSRHTIYIKTAVSF